MASEPAVKKQKFNAPVITKYPVPPHVAQAQAAQLACRVPAHAWPHYPNQQQISYGPSTNMSAYSGNSMQWPAAPHYPQASIPTQYQYQTGAYQQPQDAQAQPPAMQQYMTYPQMHSKPQLQQASPSPLQQFPHQQPISVQRQAASATPHSVSPPMTVQNNHPPHGLGVNTTNMIQAHPASHPPRNPQILAPAAPSTREASLEPEGDDIRKLDVPDMPSIRGEIVRYKSD